MTESAQQAAVSDAIGLLGEPGKESRRSATRICEAYGGIRRADFVYAFAATAHKALDSNFIKRHASLIVDAPGVCEELAENIVKA